MKFFNFKHFAATCFVGLLVLSLWFFVGLRTQEIHEQNFKNAFRDRGNSIGEIRPSLVPNDSNTPSELYLKLQANAEWVYKLKYSSESQRGLQKIAKVAAKLSLEKRNLVYEWVQSQMECEQAQTDAALADAEAANEAWCVYLSFKTNDPMPITESIRLKSQAKELVLKANALDVKASFLEAKMRGYFEW